MSTKISIITPSFNQGEFIRDTIESVLNQNYPNFEHIVVDAGSTDSTVEILKSYPHLIWTSEPDRGQTHALNKGLSKATGEIVTWLNSDDWYAPQIFSKVAQALSNHDLVMGGCHITNRQGVVDYTVPNVPRSWFDILKYWCSYSIPTQPSIFFRRDILDKVLRKDGTFLDESLHFCMDYDLWLRLWQVAKVAQIPEVLSYYRMYEDNKTGQGMDPLLPEMSRIFRRHSNLHTEIENSISIVIPVKTVSDSLSATLASISALNIIDSEILLVYFGTPSEEFKKLKEFSKTIELSAHYTGDVRLIKAESVNVIEALNIGAKNVRASITVFLEAGATLSPQSVGIILNTFFEDKVGLAVPLLPQFGTDSLITAINGDINLDALFKLSFFGFNFAVRTVAFEDVGGFRFNARSECALKDIIFRLRAKGWFLKSPDSYLVSLNSKYEKENEQLNFESAYLASRLIIETSRQLGTDPFSVIRANHGYSIVVNEDVLKGAEEILRSAPAEWKL